MMGFAALTPSYAKPPSLIPLGGRRPWRDLDLEHAEQRRQGDAQEAERHDRHEHLVDLIGRGGPHDQIADARDGGVEVREHHADQPAADREPQAGDDERQRAWQHNVEPELAFAAAERASNLDQPRIDILHALIGIDGHGEEREQKQDDDLGGGLEAGPQHDQGDEGDARRGVKERDVDAERYVEYPEPRQQQADRDADNRRGTQAQQQHDETRPQIFPQFATPDHVHGCDRDLGRRREQDRIDPGPEDLPDRQYRSERTDPDRDFHKLAPLAPPRRDLLGALSV